MPGANPRRIGDRLIWVVRKSNYLTYWATRALRCTRSIHCVGVLQHLSTLKQQSHDINRSLPLDMDMLYWLWLTESEPIFSLNPEVANTNFIVFCFTLPGLSLQSTTLESEHANHYTTDGLFISKSSKETNLLWKFEINRFNWISLIINGPFFSS